VYQILDFTDEVWERILSLIIRSQTHCAAQSIACDNPFNPLPESADSSTLTPESNTAAHARQATLFHHKKSILRHTNLKLDKPGSLGET
jgi:hypothetical protein